MAWSLKAIAGLGKLSPAPAGEQVAGGGHHRRQLREHLEQLRDCDLIIEAIAERMDWKQDLYKKIAPFMAPCGARQQHLRLGINTLAEVLAGELRPASAACTSSTRRATCTWPRLIPAKSTDARGAGRPRTFLTTTLGKGVVYAKDTPNFIGNRIGVFSILAVIHHTAAFGSASTKSTPSPARWSAAPSRHLPHLGRGRPGHHGPRHQDHGRHPARRSVAPVFQIPAWLQALIGKGALGQKTGAGIFRKVGKDIQVLDLARSRTTARPTGAAAPEVVEILKTRNPGREIRRAARQPASAGAVPVGHDFRDLFHYSAYHLADIADTARDVDLAIRWGYGWSLGPFETWQAAGWKQVAQWIADDIVAGKAMSAHRCRPGCSTAARACTPPRAATARRATPSCRAPPCPSTSASASPTRCWARCSHPARRCSRTTACACGTDGDDIAVVSFKTKMHTVNDAVLDGLQEAIAWPSTTSGPGDLATEGAVLRRCRPVRCAGRAPGRQARRVRGDGRQLPGHQPAHQVLAGAGGGGGARPGAGRRLRVPDAQRPQRGALESYIGLVEAGVGLLPAGGGLKEIAVRASQAAGPGGDVFAELKKTFETVAMAKVSASAVEAKELGLVRATTRSCSTRTSCCTSPSRKPGAGRTGYRPPLPARASRWPATSASPPSR
jgi:3-hydroxyacyl-CoA dehydrogenase